MTKKYGYKYFSQKKRKNIFKKLSIINIFLLVLQMSLGGFLFIASSNVAEAVSENACSADVDVVLVMDRSGSMGEGGSDSKCEWQNLEPSGGTNMCIYHEQDGLTESECEAMDDGLPQCPYGPEYTPGIPNKIKDAQTAANTFLGYLGINDQSGLVSFADDANLDQTLTNSHSNTQAKVDDLVAGGLTNIGDALNLANGELGSENSNPQAVKAMILLTDGKANQPNGNGSDEDPLDVAYAEEMAGQATTLGYKIFTIGLGSDVNVSMLQNIASMTGAQYYYAPSSSDLANIYKQIREKMCEYASISGCKYVDSDGDGDISDEDTLSGWIINLGGDKIDSQKTDSEGCYSFTGLEPGTYTISEDDNQDIEGNWVQTYGPDLDHDFNVDWEDHINNVDFGNYFIPDNASSTVYVKKFVDNAASSSAGWEMSVSASDGDVNPATSTTLADAWIPFNITLNNSTSSVQVNEVLQNGYNLADIVCTLGLEGSAVGNSDYGCGGIYDIEVENGSEIYCSFYNETASISGCTDDNAVNYNSDADTDDGSCEYCGNGTCESDYDESCSTCPSDCGSCGGGDDTVYGCTDENAVNYNSGADVDDDSCEYCGNGTCESDYDESCSTCSEDCGSCSSGGGFFTYTNQGETAPQETIVLGEEGAPAIVVEKTISQTFANNGDEGIEYQIVVANNGNLSAFDVVLNDTLPKGFVYSGTEETTKTWDLGEIESGKSVITKYKVDILSSTKAGVYENIATVSASNHEEISDTASLEVREVAVLAETGFDIKEFAILGLIFIFLSTSALYLRRKVA